jgi:hypothetical protein
MRTAPKLHGAVSTQSATTAASVHQPNRAQRRCERSIPEVYGLHEACAAQLPRWAEGSNARSL